MVTGDISPAGVPISLSLCSNTPSRIFSTSVFDRSLSGCPGWAPFFFLKGFWLLYVFGASPGWFFDGGKGGIGAVVAQDSFHPLIILAQEKVFFLQPMVFIFQDGRFLLQPGYFLPETGVLFAQVFSSQVRTENSFLFFCVLLP